LGIDSEYKGENLILLIGAARSGTKMLRDIISNHSSINKVPFDINYVWKYGNEHITHDALDASHTNNKSTSFIRSYLSKRKKDNSFLVEKTVSNTLRVDFVYKIFPKAKFIHLTRDGRDVVESVSRQWGISPSNKYLLEKLKTFPASKVLSYGANYARDLIKINVLGKPSNKYVWGVKYPNYEEDLITKNTLQFCAIQWLNCIAIAEKQFQNIPSENVLDIRYEKFVTDPRACLAHIQEFIGVQSQLDNSQLASITPSNIGKGFQKLNLNQQGDILKIIEPTLEKLKYK